MLCMTSFHLIILSCRFQSAVDIAVSHPINGALNVSALAFESVVIYGVAGSVASVDVDGSSASSFTVSENVLTVDNLSMALAENHNLSWS